MTLDMVDMSNINQGTGWFSCYWSAVVPCVTLVVGLNVDRHLTYIGEVIADVV